MAKFPFILKIRKVLLHCHNQGIEVVLAWIPGHCGIQGNVTVDLCAKDAIDSGTLDHYVVFSSDLIPLARQSLSYHWQDHFNMASVNKGKYYADIQVTVPPKPWFFKFKDINKRTASTVCRLRLGHSCTPVHLAKLHIRDSSVCECGLDEGSPDHIFFSCSKYPHSLYDILPSEIPRPINFKSLLSLVYTPFVYTLCEYINLNNIKL